MSIYDFMIVQQKNGFGEFSFVYQPPEWIKNPISEEEKHFSSIFSGIEFKLWDEESGENIKIECESKPIDGKNYDVKLKAPAGGPYTLFVKFIFIEGEKVTSFGWEVYHTHIGVGDVFVIAGQSNAEGIGRGLLHDGPQIGVSTFKKNGKWDIATHPISGVQDTHSPFLRFAKTLYKECGYPIGLIPRAVGGTYVTQWAKGGNLMEPLKEEIKRENIKAKAILWYQGENEADKNGSVAYFENTLSAFTELRAALGDPELPIFLFQLNRTTLHMRYSDEGYSIIREIQRTLPKKISNTYVIPTIDAHIMSDWIHNSRSANMMLGERLAYYTLDCLYHKKHMPKAPDIASAKKTSDDTLLLEFDNVEGQLYTFLLDTCKIPIIITDENGEVEKAHHLLGGNTITVKCNRPIGKDAVVSGMYGADPGSIIIDIETQMPVLPFYKFKITE